MASDLTSPVHHSCAAQRLWPRESVAPALLKAADSRSSHQGEPVALAAGARFGGGATAISRSPSTTKTLRIASTDGPGHPIAAPTPRNLRLNDISLEGLPGNGVHQVGEVPPLKRARHVELLNLPPSQSAPSATRLSLGTADGGSH